MLKRSWQLTILCALLISPMYAMAAGQQRFVHSSTVYVDGEGERLNRPEGVACRTDAIVVADTGNGRLVQFSLSRGEIGGGREIRVREASHPIQVHLGRKGEIFFLDGRLRRVVRLDSQGRLQGVVEPDGMPNAGTTIVRAFALDLENNVYHLDVFGRRVIVTDFKGTYLRDIPLPEGRSFSDVAVDARGVVYVLDSVEAAVHVAGKGEAKFSRLGADIRKYMDFPISFAKDNRGGLFLVDRNGAGIVHLGPDGSYLGRQLAMGWKPGLLYYPSQLCFTSEDGAVIADRDNSRIQIYRVAR